MRVIHRNNLPPEAIAQIDSEMAVESLSILRLNTHSILSKQAIGGTSRGVFDA
jgi:hypothetical protein